MEDQSQVYKEFEAFDFDNEDFQNGLLNVYDSFLENLNQDRDGQIHEVITEIPADQKQRLEIQAKTFYFCSQTGNILNIEDYEEWKSNLLEPKVEEITEEPEYSSNYQNVVELIVNGKEVPGIKQIPDTVLEGTSSESKLPERKKPWETQKEPEELDHEFENSNEAKK
ncbi:hypothetical protein WICMUC_002020 [Wickerhamomyces mucosus]|uniref:Uncharacterized protein n=1 Tax=Wickerhamomyces mucosus TaxID=1378264 RepID=A0A9P8PRY7_9ASCO|nr:hypothetical protein WICMUC_002020 [Wickerhamomyces mucosus]